MKKIVLTLAAFVIFFTQEALVSQVHIIKNEVPLTKSISAFQEIWIVTNLKQTVQLKKVVFPKSTHWNKASETVYEELADLFILVEPLKNSDSRFKKDQIIKLKKGSVYSEEMVKLYHEKNQSESPFLKEYKNQFPLEGKQQILFFSSQVDPKSENLEIVTGILEGLGAKEFILNPEPTQAGASPEITLSPTVCSSSNPKKTILFDSSMLKPISSQFAKEFKSDLLSPQVRIGKTVGFPEVEAVIENTTTQSLKFVISRSQYSQNTPFTAYLQSNENIRYTKRPMPPPAAQEQFYLIEIPPCRSVIFSYTIGLNEFSYEGAPEGEIFWVFQMYNQQSARGSFKVKLPRSS